MESFGTLTVLSMMEVSRLAIDVAAVTHGMGKPDQHPCAMRQVLSFRCPPPVVVG
jgi:hypothetical protein